MGLLDAFFSAVGRVVVPTSDRLIVVADAGSEAVGPHVWEDARQILENEDDGERFEHFAGSWQGLQDEGLLAGWTFEVDGLYAVELRLLPEEATVDWLPEGNVALLGGEDREVVVNCESGALVVGSPRRLAEGEPETALSVAPGKYRVSLHVEAEQVSRHEAMSEGDEYPEDEGPDFVVTLQRV